MQKALWRPPWTRFLKKIDLDGSEVVFGARKWSPNGDQIEKQTLKKLVQKTEHFQALFFMDVLYDFGAIFG